MANRAGFFVDGEHRLALERAQGRPIAVRSGERFSGLLVRVLT